MLTSACERLRLAELAVLIALAAACGHAAGGDEGSSDGLDPVSRPTPDLTVQSVILDDGVVTRAELEQAYAMMFECLREAGAVGEVWLGLDFEPGYGIALAVPDSAGRFPDDREIAAQLIDALLTHCEEAYIDRLVPVYAEQNSETRAQGEQKLQMVVACLNEKLPDLAQRVSDEWDLETIRTWVYSETENAGELGLVADQCVNYFGIPWQDLENM